MVSKGYPYEFSVPNEEKRGNYMTDYVIKDKEKSRLYQTCKPKVIFTSNIKPLADESGGVVE